jgi:hypothetical protein
MKLAMIFFVILAVVGLVGAAASQMSSEADVTIRALALTNAVEHHSSLMVQEYRVDVVVTANRFERYLRFGYAGK